MLEEVVSYRRAVTGVENTIFISPKGRTRQAARIKLAIDPPTGIDPRGETASIAISDGAVIAGERSPLRYSQECVNSLSLTALR